jgi:glycosyltransferase involved in cell wall biosynthesis
MKWAIAFLKYLWRFFPMRFRSFFWNIIGLRIRHFVDRLLIARPGKMVPPENQAPLVVAGTFRTANGIGQAARQTFYALESAGLSPIAVDLSKQLASVDLEVPFPLQAMPAADEGVLIMQINGPETMAALQHLKMGREKNWYTIGYWAWELPVFPAGWERAFPFLSELWTISEFSAKALRQHKNAPQITVFGHSIHVPKHSKPDRALFNLPKDAFVFLSMADSMSSLTRKNPFTTIAGFKRAFAKRGDVHLVIKVRNLKRYPQADSDLRTAINGAPNISLIDATLTDEELWTLLSSIDCFVSLHRSEGFGLTIVEAMALKKPVIVTAWSGNMDFTTSENAYLIEPKFIPCTDKYGVYSGRKTVWADVDESRAAEAMMNVLEHPKSRQKIASKGQRDILRITEKETLGRAMKARVYGEGE